MNPEAQPGYRPEIDGLRALAVLSVVLFHMGLRWFPGGYVGVDVFLVISGYLIMGIVWRQSERAQFSFSEFYRRRVLRLFPALLLVVLATLVLGAIILLPSDLARLGRSVMATMVYVSNVWLWRNTGYFDESAETLPLLHTWSLSVEEQFYLVLPVALVLVHARMRRWTLPILIATALGTLALSQYFLVSRQSMVFYLTPLRAWEFIVGGLLAIAEPRRPSTTLSKLVSWSGLVMMLAPVFVYSSRTDFPGVSAIPPTIGTAMLLAAVRAPYDGLVGRFLVSRPMAWIGKLSYSLYLWHWPILVLWHHAGDGPRTASELVVALVLVFGLSFLSYRFVELPYRDPAGPRARGVLVYSLVGSAVLLAIGFGMNVSHGIPSRLPPEVVELDRAREPSVPFVECFGPDVPPGGDCRLGAREVAPRWMLWGDSHALALAPALHADLEAKNEAALFVASSTCPPLFGIRSRDVRSGDWKCERVAARVRRALDDHASISGVIMVAIWPDYFSQASTAVLSDDHGERGNAEIMRNAIPSTIAGLRDAGRTVIVVGRVPRHPWSVPYEMARRVRWNEPFPIGQTRLAERTAHGEFWRLVRGIPSPDAVTQPRPFGPA